MATASLVEPGVLWVPDHVSVSAGEEAADLARLAGLELDPWQEFVLVHSMAERAGGKWAAFEWGLCVARQNGKGAVIEARELASLFLLGDSLVIHSAHLFDTSLEAFRRLWALIEGTPELEREVKRMSRAHGEEGIELRDGARIRFRTRTKDGGRGLTGDLLILDEAMIIPPQAHGSLMPTLSARPNPQVAYLGSAVDRRDHQHGVVFARLRERALAGGDQSMAFFGWEPRVDVGPDGVTAEMAADRALWEQGNPALGIRIDPEHVARELLSMDLRKFAVERLGIGDWPSTGPEDRAVIPWDTWVALADDSSVALDPVCFAFDVTPQRSWGTVSAVGRREDGAFHAEVVARGRGAGWLPGRLRELVEKHRPVGVVCDGASPAAALVPQLAELNLDVLVVGAREAANGCGMLFDAVMDGALRHLGQEELDSAVRGAVTRPLGEAWAWGRNASGVDISPLVSVTLALFGLVVLREAPGPWCMAW